MPHKTKDVPAARHKRAYRGSSPNSVSALTMRLQYVCPQVSALSVRRFNQQNRENQQNRLVPPPSNLFDRPVQHSHLELIMGRTQSNARLRKASEYFTQHDSPLGVWCSVCQSRTILSKSEFIALHWEHIFQTGGSQEESLLPRQRRPSDLETGWT